MSKKKLTVELSLEEMVELNAAVVILRARNKSTLIHGFIIDKINEAKASVSEFEFKKICSEEKESLLNRSEQKQAERLQDKLKLINIGKTAETKSKAHKR